MGCDTLLGTGLRRREVLDRLDRLESTGSGDFGRAGSALVGGGGVDSGMAMVWERMKGPVSKFQPPLRNYKFRP